MDFLDEEQPRKSKFPFIIGSVLAVLVIAAIGYFVFRYREAQKLLSNPAEAAKKEQLAIIKRVSELVVVPDGEEPTVATIADIEKLKDKPFFTTAQNGDKVLIYAGAKKAILYRPSSNRVVEMSPLNQPAAAAANPEPTGIPAVAGESIQAVPTPTVQPEPSSFSVTIMNGTRIAGLAAKAESFLTGQSEKYTVASTGNAQNRSQEKTVVVDLTGTNPEAVRELATIVSGTVTKLPAGEITPSTDLLLILGTDASF